jgi:hypothetical protein
MVNNTTNIDKTKNYLLSQISQCKKMISGQYLFQMTSDKQRWPWIVVHPTNATRRKYKFIPKTIET